MPVKILSSLFILFFFSFDIDLLTMDDSIILNNDTEDTTDRSDEIVNDIISLIHSTTHSSYVTCSQLSSKLISYLSQVHINDNQWNDLGKAVEVNFFNYEKNKNNLINFLFVYFFSVLIKVLIIQICVVFDN